MSLCFFFFPRYKFFLFIRLGLFVLYNLWKRENLENISQLDHLKFAISFSWYCIFYMMGYQIHCPTTLFAFCISCKSCSFKSKRKQVRVYMIKDDNIHQKHYSYVFNIEFEIFTTPISCFLSFFGKRLISYLWYLFVIFLL